MDHLCRLVPVSFTFCPSEFGPSLARRNRDTRGGKGGRGRKGWGLL